MKRLLLKVFLLVILAAGAFGFFLWRIQSDAVSRDGTSELSARSREFMQKEGTTGAGIWSDVQFESKTIELRTEVGSRIETDCFTFVLSVATVNNKYENDNDKCTFTSRVVSPPARLIVSAYALKNAFEKDTGIQIRRNSPDIYIEEEFVVPSFDQVAFFREGEGVLAFGHISDKMVTISFTQMLQPERLSTETVREMMESVAIIK